MTDTSPPAPRGLLDRAENVRKALSLVISLAVATAAVIGTLAGGWSYAAGVVRDLALIRPMYEGQVEDRAAIARLSEAVKSLDAEMQSVMGESRVTMQGDQISYVREPVHAGEQVTLVLYIGRTEIGAACSLREAVPLFIDTNGVARPGEPFGAAAQLSPQIARREITIPQPPGIPPGQTTLSLQLEYECGDAEVFEATHPVLFDILPRKE